MLSAALNSFMAVMFGVVTFGLNGFILRHVSKETLGIINVRLILLNNTVLFFGRECFRRACIKRPENDKEWKGIINLMWISVPLTVTLSSLLGYVWMNHLELPDNSVILNQYRPSVLLICLAVTVESLNEVFWNITQMFLFVKFRSTMEFMYVSVRALIMVGVVLVAPEMAVVGFCMATVFVVVLQFVAFNTYIYLQIGHKQLKEEKEEEEVDGSMPFTSIADLYPDLSGGINKERLTLTVSFFKQGIFKQLLTEGERYMFTWFSLISLAQQGVYDVVSSFGAMAARLIFSKVEEAAYFYFSQTVTRGSPKDKAETVSTAERLYQLLRSMTLIGLVVAIFGQFYSHALLHLYGGTKLSEGMGPELLRGQSIFVLFMAVNGISECFAFAAMTDKQLSRYNFSLALMTVIFLALSYYLAQALGPIGFVWANCANFSMRIAHNCYVINARFNDAINKGVNVTNPLMGMVANKGTLVCLCASAIICYASETHVYDHGSPLMFVSHIAIGAICFLTCVLQIILSEPFLNNALVTFLKSKKLLKTD